eukprot:TRINITY_DN4040_c0_g2_i1.p1 TRINITY_DN4040_c0_g2~~TRINITY_DN4040_c0_g2_i1.p1  ORF type:complete len:872 (+),score=228.44 TRINITY_DN4040_c0_g2_i1:53-2668(+)
MPAVACLLLCAGAAATIPPRRVEINTGTLVEVWGSGVVRIVHAAPPATAEQAAAAKRSLAVLPGGARAATVSVDTNTTAVTVRAGALTVVGERGTGRVALFDAEGGELWRERAAPVFAAATDMGKPAHSVEQTWETTEGAEPQAWYGGGQFQNGFVDYANAPVAMTQFNTEAVVPYFASTAGFGVLWDNGAQSYLNPPTEELRLSVFGHAPLRMGSPGRYCFHAVLCEGKYGCMLATAKLTVTASGQPPRTAIAWVDLANAPSTLTGCVDLSAADVARAHTVRLVSSVLGAKVFVTRPEQARVTTLRSALGDLVDYYVTRGPGGTLDEAVAGYRQLTGSAPLYPRWAFGFWQSKEHYHTQAAVLDAAAQFRARGIPVDAIVQDWMYWGRRGWGPHWDPQGYPDPRAMVATLRGQNVRFMVSVWSKFGAETDYYKEMAAAGHLLGGSPFYDVWDAGARELFYGYSKASHFDAGVDALWLDGTEPPFSVQLNQSCAAGSANRVANTYSLMTATAVADGLRRDFPAAQGARVFSLTRSSFAGQQRTGAALWSGDISGSWDSLRRQVAASLNYQLSGMPYWSQDIGGFWRPVDQYTSAAYHRLMTRWFQFGVFTPIFRVHGMATNTELWHYPAAVMENVVASAINLRYRLLPYTYSGFAAVGRAGATMQRHLAFDFMHDSAVRRIADQFMWGGALLVAPVVTPDSARAVYLPYVPGGWVSFFNTSEVHAGAGWVDVHASLSEIPVFVRAGSILPLGPLVKYHDEKPSAPLEVRVHPGADGTFALYEDDGHSRGHLAAPSQASTIVFRWHDAARTLAIDARAGAFDGMLRTRVFDVVVCEGGAGSGVAPASAAVSVVYTGAATAVALPSRPDAMKT